jgi:hypothetical protein
LRSNKAKNRTGPDFKTLLKRMARGHDAAGVRGTNEGQCAVLCPACPIPGVNLPVNWKERPTSQQ